MASAAAAAAAPGGHEQVPPPPSSPTAPNGMTCNSRSSPSPNPRSSSSGNSYEHHERITLSPLLKTLQQQQPNASSTKKLGVDVTVEAYSSLTLAPNGAAAGAAAGGGAGTGDGSTSTSSSSSPFPPHVVELMYRHGLERLLIQVGSSSSSSTSTSSSSPSEDSSVGEERFGSSGQPSSSSSSSWPSSLAAAEEPRFDAGPSGTSVYARFFQPPSSADNNVMIDGANGTNGDRAGRFESLLRTIVGSRLICAPLDSVSITKNQHLVYPLGSANEHHVNLPSQSGHLCHEGLYAFRNLLLPCRDGAGLFVSGSSSSSSSPASSSASSTGSNGGNDKLLLPSSDLLLGSAPQSRFGARTNLWIELRADGGDDCFRDTTSGEGCTLSIHQGVSYGIEVDAKAKAAVGDSSSTTTDTASLSLADVLVGGDDAGAAAKTTAGAALAKQKMAAATNKATLVPCPLADSSVVRTILPLPPTRVNDGDGDNDESGSGHRPRVKFAHPFIVDGAATEDDVGGAAAAADATGGSSSSSSSTNSKGGYEYNGESNVVAHDLQSLLVGDTTSTSVSSADGINLAKKWMAIEVTTAPTTAAAAAAGEEVGVGPLYSVDRTVLRPRGIAGGGTFRTVYRNENSGAAASPPPAATTTTAKADDESEENRSSSGGCDANAATVQTMDVYPKFVTPIFQSLTVTLYEGGGAGDQSFVAPLLQSSSMNGPAGAVVVEGSGYGGHAGVRATQLSLSDLPHHSLALDDDGSASLRLTTDLPPDSSLWVSMDYDPRFLPFEHFPSDPNRGIDVPPSYGSFAPSPCACSAFNLTTAATTRLYTPSVLVMPPVPDMSMPFNVISLTCTIYAFILGSAVNFLVRKSSQSVSDAYKGKTPKNKLAKMKEKLAEMKEKIRLRLGHLSRERIRRRREQEVEDILEDIVAPQAVAEAASDEDE